MPRPANPDRNAMIIEFIKANHQTHTINEMGRMINVPGSTIRFHGVGAGVQFKYRRSSKEKVVIPEGKFFNEAARENWLV